MLFAVQVSFIPCHAVKRRSMVGFGNAEAMRQLTHRHLIPGLIAFGNESELQYAAGGLNQQMRARMHFTHGRSTIGIGRHAVHGGGRGGLYGRRIDVGRLLHNDLISHWLKNTLQSKCPQPCVSHMAAGRSS